MLLGCAGLDSMWERSRSLCLLVSGTRLKEQPLLFAGGQYKFRRLSQNMQVGILSMSTHTPLAKASPKAKPKVSCGGVGLVASGVSKVLYLDKYEQIITNK